VVRLSPTFFVALIGLVVSTACSVAPAGTGSYNPTVFALEQLQQAEAAERTGDAEAALGHLEKAVADDPGYAAAWRAYGLALTRTGQQAEALAAFERLVTLRPDYPVGFVVAGLLAEALGDLEDATAYYAAGRDHYGAMPDTAENQLTEALCIYLADGKVPGMVAMAAVVEDYPEFHRARFLLQRVTENDRAYFLRWVGVPAEEGSAGAGTSSGGSIDSNLDALLGEQL
jgi:tetratricopeptide (TPR) repeat protein